MMSKGLNRSNLHPKIGEKKRSFMIRANRESLWQVLRMYDVGGKLMNGIMSIHVNSLACVRVKGDESECFRIDRGVRKVVLCHFGSSMCIWMQG